MAALTAPRKISKRDDLPKQPYFSHPMKANTHAWGGGIAVNDAGYAAPARTATGLKALGVFRDNYDNSSGSAGALVAEIDRGPFKFNNSASTDQIQQADAFTLCYLVDDQTVAKTSGSSTRSVAGIVIQIDADGVWVELGDGSL